MPDKMRINGPEGTKSIAYFYKKENLPLLTNENKRLDGRRPEDARPIFLDTGVVSQAQGSAYLESGKMKIICSVYGPREVQLRRDFSIKGQLSCEFKYAPYSCHIKRQHQQDNEEKELSALLEQALESVVCLHKFPKSKVDIFIMVLECDGNALASALTCASAALTNAGVEIYDLVIGGSLALYENHYLIDPTTNEKDQVLNSGKAPKGNIILGIMPSLQQVTSLVQEGEMKPLEISNSIKTLIDSCHAMYVAVQKLLLKSIKRQLIETEENTAEK